MVDSVLRHNQTTALLIHGGAVELSGSHIDGVAPGRFHHYDPTTHEIVATFEDVSDGLIAAAGSTLQATSMVVSGAGRAGVLFEASQGSLHGVTSTAGRYGLVLQDSPEVDWQEETNAFAGGEQSILNSGSLPVPSAPPMPE